MRLKTYIVDNVTEAIPMIKRDLGADALILNTKRVKKGGFLGLFQKEKLEVIAAAEAKAADQAENSGKKEPAIFQQPESEPPLENKAENQKPLYEEEQTATDLIAELKSIKHFMMGAMEEDRLPKVLKTLNKKLVE